MEKKNKEINYLSLFILGCSLLSVGVIFRYTINLAFITIMASGIGLIAIGIANRDNWSGTMKKTKASENSCQVQEVKG